MKQTRRSNALVRLEKQLVSGVKTAKIKEGLPLGTKIPLTDHDKVRIQREIELLKK